MEEKKCWKECNRRGGKCTFCGEGYCCNGKQGTYPGWNGNCPNDAIAVAPQNGHKCIQYIETTPVTTTTANTETSSETIIMTSK